MDLNAPESPPGSPPEPPAPLPDAATPSWAPRLAHLRRLLRDLGRVVVAWSGGVDSAVLLKVAAEELGDGVVALTAVSASYPPWELAEARSLAAAMGVRMIEVATHELDRPGYRANAGDRCYHCKAELFDVARLEAEALAFGALCYGAIPDDLGDHRPGMRAAAERSVRAPLIEAGLSKRDVRAVARALGLPVWDKPASACLASRFPDGTEVTAERLGQVAACEGALRALGLRQFRARFHGALVRVEVAPEELPGIFADAALRAGITAAGKAAGFRFVALDLEGYRTGSANAPPLVQIG